MAFPFDARRVQAYHRERVSCRPVDSAPGGPAIRGPLVLRGVLQRSGLAEVMTSLLTSAALRRDELPVRAV